MNLWTKDAACNWSATCLGVGIESVHVVKLGLRIQHMYDMLGNELPTDINYKGVIIYRYEDGTTKKVLRID